MIFPVTSRAPALSPEVSAFFLRTVLFAVKFLDRPPGWILVCSLDDRFRKETCRTTLYTLPKDPSFPTSPPSLRFSDDSFYDKAMTISP